LITDPEDENFEASFCLVASAVLSQAREHWSEALQCARHIPQDAKENKAKLEHATSILASDCNHDMMEFSLFALGDRVVADVNLQACKMMPDRFDRIYMLGNAVCTARKWLEVKMHRRALSILKQDPTLELEEPMISIDVATLKKQIMGAQWHCRGNALGHSLWFKLTTATAVSVPLNCTFFLCLPYDKRRHSILR